MAALGSARVGWVTAASGPSGIGVSRPCVWDSLTCIALWEQALEKDREFI